MRDQNVMKNELNKEEGETQLSDQHLARARNINNIVRDLKLLTILSLFLDRHDARSKDVLLESAVGKMSTITHAQIGRALDRLINMSMITLNRNKRDYLYVLTDEGAVALEVIKLMPTNPKIAQ